MDDFSLFISTEPYQFIQDNIALLVVVNISSEDVERVLLFKKDESSIGARRLRKLKKINILKSKIKVYLTYHFCEMYI